MTQAYRRTARTTTRGEGTKLCVPSLVLVLAVAGCTDSEGAHEEGDSDAGAGAGGSAAGAPGADGGSGSAAGGSEGRASGGGAGTSADGGGGPAPGTGGTQDPGAGGAPITAGPCGALGIDAGTSVDGFTSDVFRWSDSSCRPRSAALVRNDQRDPSGNSGGYLRRYVYEASGQTRTCDGSFDAHPGFGYVVSHAGDGATLGHEHPGTHEIALAGRHHAIHRYDWTRMPIQGQNVAVTIQWMFVTGRDHPLWAITYDLTGVPADSVNGDTRAPYGDLRWDGGEDADVAGVGWGDRYRFVSLDSPITMQSGWDYSQPNTVPYAMEWATSPDAEMGLVQTQTYLQHDAGGYWSYTTWGTRDEDGPMPEDWNWTYQLNQYELPWGSKSKRLAWGSNYGAVGQRSYNAYGDDRTLSGYPYQSYAVFIVLGEHSSGAVTRTVAGIEAVQTAELTAIAGTVAAAGPAGAGRTDTAPYQPRGWDPVHAAWVLEAAGGRASVRIRPGAPLTAPTFLVRSWSSGAAPRVTRDGGELVADVDYFASVDAAGSALWLTLPGQLSDETVLSME